jgi:hypothetical protein
MIMRGFIGGGKKMQPTMAYIKSIITKDAHCNRGVACKTYKTKFNIDPVLFQRYQITQVPTLVYEVASFASFCISLLILGKAISLANKALGMGSKNINKC